MESLPCRYSYMYSSDSNTHTPMDFNDLRKGNRVGLRIAHNGSLMFHVNGKVSRIHDSDRRSL